MLNRIRVMVSYFMKTTKKRQNPQSSIHETDMTNLTILEELGSEESESPDRPQIPTEHSGALRIGWAVFVLAISHPVRFVILPIGGFLLTAFLWAALTDVSLLEKLHRDIERMPNYNFIPEIQSLRAEGRHSEALELAKYILQNPDLPGQEEAEQLAQEIEHERNSLIEGAKEALKGFISGDGESIQALAGAVSADMIIYGDIRDLVKQGYYQLTKNEDKADPVIVALSGVGILTEVVDFADWTPSILKAFRKVGALSDDFVRWLLKACDNSIKARKLDFGLRIAFDRVKMLTNSVGMGRAATMFKHIDTPDDLSAIAKIAQQSPDTAYIMLKVGGDDALMAMKAFDSSDEALGVMSLATKKGVHGIEWLSKGGSVGATYLFRTRILARILRTLYLGRPQALVSALAKQYEIVKQIFWGILIGAFLFSLGLMAVNIQTIRIKVVRK